jgi:transcriptional regulatory protein RtcR
MSTLAVNCTIDDGVVDDELSTLKAAWRRASPAKAGSMTTFLETVLPDHSLNPFEQAQLNFVLSLCGEAKNYADLGRKVYGDDVGKNPSQRVRDFLIEHGLSLEKVKIDLAAVGA